MTVPSDNRRADATPVQPPVSSPRGNRTVSTTSPGLTVANHIPERGEIARPVMPNRDQHGHPDNEQHREPAPIAHAGQRGNVKLDERTRPRRR